MEVYVVTNPESGWDCVCGVFLSFESLRDYFMEMLEVEDDSTEDDYYKSLTPDEFEGEMQSRRRMSVIHTVSAH
jgi:hypothetical protein